VISQATQGTIREMVREIPAATLFMLVNAVYFNAFWKDQFSKAKTKVEKFTLQSGEQTDCSMMYQHWKYHYWEDNDLQMIRIPYESVQDLDLGMYIILPKYSQDLNKIVSSLDIERWNSLLERVHRQFVYGDLGLPRLKADYERKLEDDLLALGMELAFTPKADFSAMTNIPLPK
jgi:serpin B